MLSVINPASGQVIRELEEDTPGSVKEKFERLRLGQRAWNKRSFSERAGVAANFRDLLLARTEDLALTLTREMGKPLAQARGEIRATPQRIDFFLKHTDSLLREELAASREDTGGTEERITYDPLGVVANISAWNYPYFVGINVIVPALLTGNAVLYKPSEFSSLTGLAIAGLLKEAGVPEDAFACVIGGGSIGAEILKLSVDGVFFTGSHGTGKKIAEAMAGRMVPVQLELGGKDPVYVCEDVDVQKAAAALVEGAFYNAGQSCCAVERIYVQESIYEPFLKAFTQETLSLVTGNPEAENTFIGPLTRPQQIEIIERQTREAVKGGARLLTGGGRVKGPGNFLEPAVLADCSNDLSVMREESFGPVIGIARVKDDAEAARLMNDTEYGLTAGVYTASESRARSVLSQIDAGTVYWNCCDRVSPRLPWTGRKHSGIGATLSLAGIRAFLKPRAWHLRALNS